MFLSVSMCIRSITSRLFECEEKIPSGISSINIEMDAEQLLPHHLQRKLPAKIILGKCLRLHMS